MECSVELSSALIVDDNELDRWVLCAQLSEIGIKHIVEKEDGEGALEFLLNTPKPYPFNFPPKLVFVDNHMPVVDGLEIFTTLLKSSDTFDISACRFFLYSASDSPEELARYKQFSCIEKILGKGVFTLDDLRSIIGRQE